MIEGSKLQIELEKMSWIELERVGQIIPEKVGRKKLPMKMMILVLMV